MIPLTSSTSDALFHDVYIRAGITPDEIMNDTSKGPDVLVANYICIECSCKVIECGTSLTWTVPAAWRLKMHAVMDAPTFPNHTR